LAVPQVRRAWGLRPIFVFTFWKTFELINSIRRQQGKDMKNEGNGFTLLEMMVVIAVIAIMSAIAVPNLITME